MKVVKIGQQFSAMFYNEIRTFVLLEGSYILSLKFKSVYVLLRLYCLVDFWIRTEITSHANNQCLQFVTNRMTTPVAKRCCSGGVVAL